MTFFDLSSSVFFSPNMAQSIGHFGKYHNTLCLYKHCFQFLLGLTMVPRENRNNAKAKFWGDKERVLWYFLKWPIPGLIIPLPLAI